MADSTRLTDSIARLLVWLDALCRADYAMDGADRREVVVAALDGLIDCLCQVEDGLAAEDVAAAPEMIEADMRRVESDLVRAGIVLPSPFGCRQ